MKKLSISNDTIAERWRGSIEENKIYPVHREGPDQRIHELGVGPFDLGAGSEEHADVDVTRRPLPRGRLRAEEVV
jgi:hypothetical protein